MSDKKLSAHQQRRKALIDIIENCEVGGKKVYAKSTKAPSTYVASNVEDITRITIQVAAYNIMVWKVNYKAKTQPIVKIDPEKFTQYVYMIAGYQPPK
jgi:hypothetical protein